MERQWKLQISQNHDQQKFVECNHVNQLAVNMPTRHPGSCPNMNIVLISVGQENDRLRLTLVTCFLMYVCAMVLVLFPTSSMRPLDWTDVFKRYRGKFVAFKNDRKTVVGSGNTIRSAKIAAKKKGCDDPIITRMPRTLRNFIG